MKIKNFSDNKKESRQVFLLTVCFLNKLLINRIIYFLPLRRWVSNCHIKNGQVLIWINNYLRNFLYAPTALIAVIRYPIKRSIINEPLHAVSLRREENSEKHSLNVRISLHSEWISMHHESFVAKYTIKSTGVLQPNNYMLVITPINRAIFLSTKLDFGVAISKYLWYNSK